MHRKSLLIAIVTACVGLALWADDDLLLLLDVTRDATTAHRICDVMEFIFFVPGGAALGWIIAERLRRSRDRMAVLERHVRRDRMVVLGRVAASLAHEVRNPLHNLRLIMEALRQPGSLDEQEHLKGLADEDISRIDRAVDLVYRLARPRTGVITTTSCDLAKVVSASVAGERIRAPNVKIQWHSVGVARVICLEEDARTAVDNLLRNATAAADATGVAVNMRSINDAWEVRIVNYGTLPQWVLDDDEPVPSSAHAGGLGLGLSISRQLVTEAGGTLQLAQRGECVETSLSLPRQAEVAV